MNCAAIPEELIESELFGHEKGAFTGAIARKRGKFELADGGTIFLDEIGDMRLKTQAKVLRVLQESKFERVGRHRADRGGRAGDRRHQQGPGEGDRRRASSARISSTGSNVIPFHVPPLRERREDIPLLAEPFVDEFCAESGARVKAIAPKAMEASRPTPGRATCASCAT